MIDTHSHIDGSEFAEDLEEVIQRAQDAGIKKILVPGICLKDTSRLLQVCQTHAGYLYPMIGLHPENIMDEDYNYVLEQMEQIIRSSIKNETNVPPKNTSPIVAIGEIGLDLYWDTTHKEEQIEVFERQIEWAEKYDLPIVIHTRNAHAEMMEIMERHRHKNLCGVFHCFTGTEEEAQDLLSFPNFMLGIGGVLTFKKSTLRDVVKNAIPLSRIVLETDAPYMAPVPNRGKRNESSYVKHVAETLATIYGCDIDHIAFQTTRNALKVFKKVTFFAKN